MNTVPPPVADSALFTFVTCKCNVSFAKCFENFGNHLPQGHAGRICPTSCGVAFAPTSVGGRGECDPRVGANVTSAFVWQAQKFQSLEMIVSTSESHVHVLRWKIAFKQLQDAGIFVVTSISINLPHALEVSSKTLWMLRCNITSISSNAKMLWMLRSNIYFNQFPRRSGCYVPTSISINFLDALDATL